MIIPDISKQIYFQDTLDVLENNYAAIGPLWSSHHIEMQILLITSGKTVIFIIYLVKKALDFYSRNFVKLSYEEFYSKHQIEIETFSVIEVSKNLNIPKESARRKIVELEKASVIKREKKKIILDRSSFQFVKPINSIKRISRFLSSFSRLLTQEKILSENYTSEELEKVIIENFSYVWKVYYELQIPMMLEYKNFFGDLETFHIFGTCIINQQARSQSNIKRKMRRSEFIKTIY